MCADVSRGGGRPRRDMLRRRSSVRRYVGRVGRVFAGTADLVVARCPARGSAVVRVGLRVALAFFFLAIESRGGPAQLGQVFTTHVLGNVTHPERTARACLLLLGSTNIVIFYDGPLSSLLSPCPEGYSVESRMI